MDDGGLTYNAVFVESESKPEAIRGELVSVDWRRCWPTRRIGHESHLIADA